MKNQTTADFKNIFLQGVNLERKTKYLDRRNLKNGFGDNILILKSPKSNNSIFLSRLQKTFFFHN